MSIADMCGTEEKQSDKRILLIATEISFFSFLPIRIWLFIQCFHDIFLIRETMCINIKTKKIIESRIETQRVRTL